MRRFVVSSATPFITMRVIGSRPNDLVSLRRTKILLSPRRRSSSREDTIYDYNAAV